MGFFETQNFFPDFIMWLVDDTQQQITFIDPKGLALVKPNDLSNPKIQLFKTLQNEIGPKIHNPAGVKISLNSYVICESMTDTLKDLALAKITQRKILRKTMCCFREWLWFNCWIS